MKPRRANVRKTAKWSALVLGLVLVAAGAVSTVWSCSYWWNVPSGWDYVALDQGGFTYSTTPASTSFHPHNHEPRWQFGRRQSLVATWRPWLNSRGVFLPLWIPALAAFAAFGAWGALWRWDTIATRRARAGLCPVCSYDRAGIAPSSPCPECGKAMV